MVKNNHWVAESLAHNALMQTAARFFDEVTECSKDVTPWRLIGKARPVRFVKTHIHITTIHFIFIFSPSGDLQVYLRRILGRRVPFVVFVYKTARILRVHFRGNEWGHRSCGSVATTVKYGDKPLQVAAKARLVYWWASQHCLG